MKQQPRKRYYRLHNKYQKLDFYDWYIQYYCIVISLSCCKFIIIYTPVKESNSMTISITTQDGHMQKWAVLCTSCCALLSYLHTLWYKSILNKTYVALLCQLYEPSKASCDNSFNAQFSFTSYPRTKGVQSIYKAYIFTCSCIDSLKADLVPRL